MSTKLVSPTEPLPAQQGSAVNSIVERNITSLLARQRQQERTQTLQDKLATRITQFTGSMNFVYLHMVIVGGWIAINLGWLPLPKFDPSFVILAMAASVEALFLSTFILIAQNRMAALAEARANLDLQMDMLAEHEVTQILKLVVRIAEQVGIDLQEMTDLPELAKEIQPEAVMDTLEAAEKQSATQPLSNKVANSNDFMQQETE
jgi:uncharacterized membrane protein